MEHQKILKLLNEENNSKSVTIKWNIVNDNSKTNCNVGSEIIYNTEVWKSNLCTLDIGHQVRQACALFTTYITEIDGTTLDHAEDFDLVMLM